MVLEGLEDDAQRARTIYIIIMFDSLRDPPAILTLILHHFSVRLSNFADRGAVAG